jgi:predicted DNA-binding transcriptional regulator AlpA
MSGAAEARSAGAGQLALRAALAAMPADVVLTTAEATAYCGIAGSTWERMRGQGRTPPAIRLTGRTLGYRKGALDAWLAARLEAA